LLITNYLRTNDIQLPIYNSSDILTITDSNLRNLSQKLLLDTIDKERILRILNYLNRLNNDMNVFTSSPEELLQSIILKLDCKSIMLICKLSKDFAHFCEKYLDNILRQKISSITKLNTLDYTRQQLFNVCQVSFNRKKY